MYAVTPKERRREEQREILRIHAFFHVDTRACVWRQNTVRDAFFQRVRSLPPFLLRRCKIFERRPKKGTKNLVSKARKNMHAYCCCYLSHAMLLQVLHTWYAFLTDADTHHHYTGFQNISLHSLQQSFLLKSAEDDNLLHYKRRRSRVQKRLTLECLLWAKCTWNF